MISRTPDLRSAGPKIIRCALLSLLWLNPAFQGLAQPGIPKGTFRSPVDFPIFLSGTYGEIRPNHFHSGLDIRTNGASGKPVYASADGSVSRVFVSPAGFGKAVYIRHPSGVTTVYGHLDRFTGALAAFVRQQQYLQESFAVDLEIPEGRFGVKQGDLIGYSGNSGSSGGPHLHFEIRDTPTQDPLDPVVFGIQFADKTRPVIRSVRIYPFGKNSLVNFSDQPLTVQVVPAAGGYALKNGDTLGVTGNIIFGIEAWDCQDQSTLRNGIKSVELMVDDRHVFSQSIDRFSFSESRYVNSILDYGLNKQTEQRILRSYIAPGNRLDIYGEVENQGILHFTGTQPHRITYLVKDAKGNTSSLSFWVKSHPPPPGGARPVETDAPGILFSWDRPNQFITEDMRFEMPAGSLYEDLEFTCRISDPVAGSFARLYELHSEEVPVHLPCELSIRAETMPVNLQQQALIVKLEKGKFVSQGGEWSSGFVSTRIREFGAYTIAVDTLPPRIVPVNIFPGKNLSKQHTIVLTISDDLSGISTCRGTLNGQWILMDYDAKRNRLVYAFDDRLRPGTNKFRLVVTDGVGNRSEYSATLIR